MAGVAEKLVIAEPAATAAVLDGDDVVYLHPAYAAALAAVTRVVLEVKLDRIALAIDDGIDICGEGGTVVRCPAVPAWA